MPNDAPDLTAVTSLLEEVFVRYPLGNLCDVCADEIGKILQSQFQMSVQIVGIANTAFGGFTPPFLRAKRPDGTIITVATQGWHEVVRIETETDSFYLDALVFVHFGANAVRWEAYNFLWEYPGDIEQRYTRKPGDAPPTGARPE